MFTVHSCHSAAGTKDKGGLPVQEGRVSGMGSVQQLAYVLSGFHLGGWGRGHSLSLPPPPPPYFGGGGGPWSAKIEFDVDGLKRSKNCFLLSAATIIIELVV